MRSNLRLAEAAKRASGGEPQVKPYVRTEEVSADETGTTASKMHLSRRFCNRIRLEGSDVELDVLLEVLDERCVREIGDDDLREGQSQQRDGEREENRKKRTLPAPSNAAVSPGSPPPAPSSNTALPLPFPLPSGPCKSVSA